MPCFRPSQVSILAKAPPGAKRKRIWPLVGCGHCIGCRTSQARDWAMRITHETQCHPSSFFLTLTYDDEHLPEHGSLDPEDLRLFFKAWRKRLPKGGLSYFACGEYGDKTQRPHFHVCAFGDSLFPDMYSVPPRNGIPTWRSPGLESIWRKGNSEFGVITEKSASYISGYVRKKVSKRVDPDAYERVVPSTGELVLLTQEFSRVSSRPAIGKRFLERYLSDVYPRDEVKFAGVTVKPPRAYDKWLEEWNPDLFRSVKEARIQKIIDEGEPSAYAMNAREKAMLAKAKLYSRREGI